MARTKEEFKIRVQEWAEKLDIQVNSIAVRPMSNKWASCSTNGNLNFNTELLELEDDLSDYVIVHELIHFFVPNHGKLWKSLMLAYLGGYDTLEAKLENYRNLANENNSTSTRRGIHTNTPGQSNIHRAKVSQ